MPATSAPAPIRVTCQQTRFNIVENNASKEIDIKDLNITIPIKTTTVVDPAARVKAKAKAAPDALEILTSAQLRLKTGVHYGFVGRNGSGKSTILQALSQRLIPGIPLTTRIASLQQTSDVDDDAAADESPSRRNKPVLQHVIEGDAHRNMILRQLTMLTKALDSADPMAPVRAVRQIEHERLERQFAEVEKTARLRSGARGFDARKVLKDFEKQVEDSLARLQIAETQLEPSDIEADMTRAASLQAELEAQMETMKAADVEKKARVVLSGLGFKDAQLERTFDALSGGWKMRCLLATALVQSSDVLILDEPTNYLDLLGILWLQHHLESLKESAPDTIVVLVSHDRDFLNAISDETIILREKNLTYFHGNPASHEKSVRHEMLRMSRMKASQEKQIAHMEKSIQDSRRQGREKGDDKKVKQAKSREKKLDERMGMEVSAKGTRFKLNRDHVGFHNSLRDAIEVPTEERAVHLALPPSPELSFPGSLLSLDKVSFTYRGAAKPTIQEADLVVHRGDRIGVVGLNGAGKSTLINMLVQQARPSTGTAAHHPRAKVGYYSQHIVDELKAAAERTPEATALAHLMRCAADTTHALDEPDARKLLGGLGLAGRTASDTPIAKLSGGQLVRLALALLLFSPPHVLVLDEPTTHLDMPTIVALGAALRAYDGAIVLVTHDRFFMRHVVEGEPLDDDSSSGSDDGAPDDPADEHTRRIVYEVRLAKVTARSGGMAEWEGALEKRLRKLGLSLG